MGPPLLIVPIARRTRGCVNHVNAALASARLHRAALPLAAKMLVEEHYRRVDVHQWRVRSGRLQRHALLTCRDPLRSHAHFPNALRFQASQQTYSAPLHLDHAATIVQAY